jgi:hypothetical protein
LWLALVAAGVKPGDSVITTAFSFFASASAIVRAGATPVFVDVDPGTLNLDPHLADGECATNAPLHRRPERFAPSFPSIFMANAPTWIRSTASFTKMRRNLASRCVEDAAQAIGAEWNGRGAGSLGVTAAFSFYPTKNLSAYGDAGIVTTTCRDMAEHMRQTAQSWQSAALLSSRVWLERTHGRHSGGGASCEAEAHRRVELRAGEQHAATYDRLFAASGLTASPHSDWRKRAAFQFVCWRAVRKPSMSFISM